MKLTRPDLAAYVVVVVCLVGIVVCTALHVPVPDFLQFAGTTALGVGGGVALQTATNGAPAADPAPAPAPAPLPVAAPLAAPAPAWATDPAATGVMRAVKHAP